MATLFDMELRAARRDRAARVGPELFLFERVFADCLERLAILQPRFDRALLIGCPDRDWPKRLSALAGRVEVRDPGPLFAESAGAETIVEDEDRLAQSAYDLVLAIGTLDTVNDLQAALRSLRGALRPNSLFLAAMAGGETLPQLRRAMRAADELRGTASAHVHPRIEASAVAPLLEAAGFVRPVVDVDQVPASYAGLSKLVRDLRGMAATNILSARSRRPFTRPEARAAARAFAELGNGRTTETFEILHCAAWSP